MIMSAVRCFAIVMFVNGNPAIIFVMMMCIDTDLRRAMCRVVNRPSRNRNTHTKRQPYEGKQTQERTDGAIHICVSKRCRKNRQLISSRLVRAARCNCTLTD